MTPRKKWVVFAAVLGLLGGGFYFGLPPAARWYVNQQPGVQVETVEIRWDCLRLHDAKVTRPGLSLSTPLADVCRDKSVVVTGGEASVDLDALSNGGEGSGPGYRVKASGLRVHATKGDLNAELEGVSYDEYGVCFETGSVEDPSHGHAVVTKGCMSRRRENGTRTFNADRIEAHVTDYDVGEVVLDAVTVEVNHDQPYIAARVEEVTAKGGRLHITRLLLQKQDWVVGIDADAVRIEDARIFEKPLTFRHIKTQVDIDALFEPLQIEVDDLVQLYVDPQARYVSASAPCQSWLDAVPVELREEELKSLRLKGNLGFTLALQPDVKFTLKYECSTDGVPDFIKALRKPFQYVAFDSKGNEFTRQSGPARMYWTPLSHMSENIMLALNTTEDPGFAHHKGFDRQAIENSIRDNLKMGRFVRGASTISMQLAKNLWLKRSKTIGRKVQEAFLTIALESNLSKSEILELYLNVVEFGPDIYGIQAASKFYFDTDPYSLNLTQSLYLTTLLPSPRNAPSFEKRKPLIERLMKGMVAGGKVTEEQLLIEEETRFEEIDEE